MGGELKACKLTVDEKQLSSSFLVDDSTSLSRMSGISSQLENPAAQDSKIQIRRYTCRRVIKAIKLAGQKVQRWGN